MSNKSKKHHAVLPYITTPLVFILISMVFIIPISLGLLKFAVNPVHKAQQTLVMTVAEIETDSSDYVAAENESGTVSVPWFDAGKKLGELTCSPAGLSCDVFMGHNRVSDRSGAGLSYEAAKCGQGRDVRVYANATGAFKSLYNVKTGDEIVFQTSWGLYKYKVSVITEAKEPPEETGSERLILSTATSREPFAALSGNKLYVIADFVSGPKAEEVQK